MGAGLLGLEPSSGNQSTRGLACHELRKGLAWKMAHHVTSPLEDPDSVSKESLSLSPL